MPGPIDIITNARRRIARNAAIGGFLYSALPAIAGFALALAVHPLARTIEAHYGYELTSDRTKLLITLLAAAGTISLMMGAMRAWREFRRADDFVAAAEEVDKRVGAHEEIVTLATLADPAIVSETRPPRSPLFPLLFQRAAKFLEGFDPVREFPLRVGEPLKRSSIFAALVGVVMVLAMLGLVRPPSPIQLASHNLRRIADEIARTASTPGDAALAEKVRDAADALDNPNLPPQEKQKKLEGVRAEIEQRNQNAQEARSETGTGNGKGTSKGTSGSGSGESHAEQQANAQGGGSGQGQGKGQGGSESSKNQSGDGGQGSKQGGQNKDKGGKSQDRNNIDLQNELAKAEAQIQTAGAQSQGSGNEPGSDKNQPGPKAGSNPNQKGPGANPNRPGNVPKQGMSGEKAMPSGGGDQSAKDMGSNQGDTHLGEFPNATKTQRYLKPGEGNGSVTIKDARYVTFKIPNAPSANSGGRAVADTSRPTASTPYVNAPLAMTKDTTLPDEQQLVPPRYRDLIH